MANNNRLSECMRHLQPSEEPIPVHSSQRLGTWILILGSLMVNVACAGEQSTLSVSNPSSPDLNRYEEGRRQPEPIAVNTASLKRDALHATPPVGTPLIDKPTPQPTATINAAEIIAQAPSAPIDLEATTEGLTPGMRYGEVRSHLLDQGWIPHDVTTTGPVLDVSDELGKQLERMGLTEIKACAGTGQGFCRFEFVYSDRTLDNGPIVAVTTTPSTSTDTNHPEPFFYSLSIDDTSNPTYADRAFDADWFNQAKDDEQFCLEVGSCQYGQYALQDALVLTGVYDFGTTKTSVIPRNPVSPEIAWTYAKILDTQGIINFDKPTIDSDLNTTTYYEQGLPEDGRPLAWGSVTFIRLVHTDSGDVSEIIFSVQVL